MGKKPEGEFRQLHEGFRITLDGVEKSSLSLDSKDTSTALKQKIGLVMQLLCSEAQSIKENDIALLCNYTGAVISSGCEKELLSHIRPFIEKMNLSLL